jgi:hypothetical protein
MYYLCFMLKEFYILTLNLAFVNQTVVITTTTDVYILPFINLLHAAYVCKIVLPDDGWVAAAQTCSRREQLCSSSYLINLCIYKTTARKCIILNWQHSSFCFNITQKQDQFPYYNICLRIEVLTSVTEDCCVFWGMMLCSLVKCTDVLRGSCCLHCLPQWWRQQDSLRHQF